ncbi:hypothetical protein K458DRAFT_417228, partial [Lentithecium fluviatile CBS 122367]
MAFLLYHCPSVRKVSLYNFRTDDRYYQLDILRLAEHAPKIVHLEVDTGFAITTIGKVGIAYPRLRYLSVHDYAGKPAMPEFMDMIHSELKHLKTLVLPEVGQLDLGYEPPPTSTGSVGSEMLQKKYTAESTAARLAFRCLDSLQELWLSEEALARKICTMENTKTGIGCGMGVSEKIKKDGDAINGVGGSAAPGAVTSSTVEKAGNIQWRWIRPSDGTLLDDRDRL